MIESAQIRSENENNEQVNTKKIMQLEKKLGELLEETKQQNESAQHMDRMITVMKMEMEEKDNVAHQLQNEVNLLLLLHQFILLLQQLRNRMIWNVLRFD